MKNSFLLELYYEQLSKVIKNSILLSYFRIVPRGKGVFFGWKNLAELFFMVQRAITFSRRKQQLQCFLTEKRQFYPKANFYMQMKIILSLKWPINSQYFWDNFSQGVLKGYLFWYQLRKSAFFRYNKKSKSLYFWQKSGLTQIHGQIEHFCGLQTKLMSCRKILPSVFAQLLIRLPPPKITRKRTKTKLCLQRVNNITEYNIIKKFVNFLPLALESKRVLIIICS